MMVETVLGIWAGVATGLAAGLGVALANLLNERDAYRRKLEMAEPPRPTPPPARQFRVETKAGGAA
jgi:hypothetical protein